MQTLLKIDASARPLAANTDQHHGSLSRALSQAFTEAWATNNTQQNVIYRDVGVEPPDIISHEWIAACFTEPAQRSAAQQAVLAQSDTLIAELRQADLITIATPMYNYGMPAALKAWFDQIVRIHETFTFDLARGDYPLAPVLSDKTLITSHGEFGFAPGGSRATMNHLTPHIRTLSRYLDVSTLHEVSVEYQEFDDDRHRQSLAEAHSAIEALVEELDSEGLG